MLLVRDGWQIQIRFVAIVLIVFIALENIMINVKMMIHVLIERLDSPTSQLA